jgi:hypothetical protein
MQCNAMRLPTCSCLPEVSYLCQADHLLDLGSRTTTNGAVAAKGEGCIPWDGMSRQLTE